ncbi:MAG: glutathione S-transferase N-terminal domain-containing protein [archaeon]
MIKLYVRSDCPFCMKVISRARQLELVEGREYELINAAQGTPGRETVEKLGGKSQVPFLVDGKTQMFESDAIVGYLDRRFGS